MSLSVEFEDVQPNQSIPPKGILHAGHYFCTFGYRTFRPHGAGSWLLFFTEAGEGVIHQPGLRQRVQAGDVDLLGPDAYSDYGVPPSSPRQALKKGGGGSILQIHIKTPPRDFRTLKQGWLFHWIHFQLQHDWGALLDWPEVGAGWWRAHLNSHAVRRRLRDAFGRIHRDLAHGGALEQALGMTALHEILMVIFREIGGAERNLDARIQSALEVIRSNPGTPHSVASLAKKVNLSSSRLAHLFKEQTGSSVTQTVNRVRIQEAQKMLGFSDERISDIAAYLGFGSPYYFSRQFTKTMGLSPRAYRKRARGR